MTQRDYRDTVFLPKTDFPMKAGLPQKEPGILARWQAEKIYEKTRAARAGREKFILHDGPPYANGDMHIGHALNHILKDMVVRTQTLLGKDAPYVPGWDCHGLPIEWKVEEEYRKKKKNKDEVPAEEFRAECRAYAQGWVNIQREQLKRLGINGDWDNPYLTMDFQAESTIVGELLKFAENDMLYRGAKPVMWSPVEKTALAEAEVEYEDIVSTQIDVAFELLKMPAVPEGQLEIDRGKTIRAVIWTTTPWTIPVNQALAYGPDIDYCIAAFRPKVLAPFVAPEAEAPLMRNDDEYVVIATNLIDSFRGRLEKAWSFEGVIWEGKGSDLAGTLARHPIYNYLRHSRAGGNPSDDLSSANGNEAVAGDDAWEKALEFFARPRPFLAGDFVTTESGTGLVHMAPDHGEDDFDLCKANGIGPKFAVEGDGKYREDWAWLGGQGSVINPKFNAPDGPICTDLRAAGGLLAASADYKHSYPHSWRSKAKVIYRCTPQWFVPMDKVMTHISPKSRAETRWESEGGAENPAEEGLCDAPTLREAGLQAIAETRFVPEKGRNRIGAMVEGRPDWVLSRQRAWGVPITLFVDRKSGEYLVDPLVNDRIVAAIRAKGVDGWSDEAAQDLLGNGYNADDYERVTDILDVWFDSGSTHAFVLESGRWPDLLRPEGYVGPKADLYLEGSDQHRGWFQSSLLESCATRGHAPYKAVLTHGFTMDAKGFKMSKSLGNTISPLKVMETNGADIIRLWALSVDFTEDHRIGDEILKGVADQYRKLRNTFRYMLGALEGFSDAERVPVDELPELERYVLSLLGGVDATLRQAVEDFDFNTYVRTLIDFCNEDLSAFFFDIRKDCLYCDGPADPKRRAYRTMLDLLFHALVRYAAPVLVFTTEEIWASRYPEADSVHLLEWPEVPVVEASNEAWGALRELRQKVTEAIEPLRREKTVRSSLEADVVVTADQLPTGFSDGDLAELFITATVTRGQGDGVSVSPSDKHKCGRCWRHLPDVSEDGDLCGRCEGVVATLEAQP
ncbi:isoleucyl-tRNA synthetase [Novosphingobium sp. Rr 2-17]|uniref:isoleucine--tRNA ligase n=1 Tax=Novosphingobium sp. Rr 2-17 TaxID=555793 RepID=UPI000269ABBC|nr:isoleucine--tRNA ligase [Novosphingobium sp. Rr 2-17]EIZ77629.1 isoleucyl-tRNA synthetase [Novosphingobium sp. Rr 2-17]